MIPISVIIPVYNAEVFLRETIDSVLSQTFSGFELLLLEDGSTDSSSRIIQSYKDSRIHYISCSHNFISTLNKGLNSAKGKYIALLDHDDIMLPQRLRIQYDFMENNPDIAACGGYMQTFGKYSTEMEVPLKHEDIILTMLLHGAIWNPTGFFRRETIIKHGIRYQNGYSFFADYKFWSEIAKVGRLANIPQILTLYRTSDEQTSVKYQKQCKEGEQKVKMEMLEYFLSNLKEENKLAEDIDHKLIPIINEMGELGFFTEQTFFSFMYELVKGLIANGAIDKVT